ncbi:MAG: RHS repeat-associated core domain-containing protein [Xenococcus sp. (in: cyanobacteria)]
MSTTDTINGVTGGTNNYNYDILNRVIDITQTGTGISNKRVEFGYNALGQFTAIDRYRDTTGSNLVVGTSYAYDELNRLTNLTHNNGTTDVAFYDFTYDASSRITQISNVDGITDHTYDDRSQLTGADYSDNALDDEQYTYDANGNRIDSNIHGNGYITGEGNRLLSDGTYNYEYDNEGNLIRQTNIATGEIQELEWDYRDRLVAIIDKDAAGNETQRAEFTYDAFNRRISKAVDTNPQDANDAVVTHFVYDREDVLLDFVDADGVSGINEPQLVQRYLHGPGIDRVLAQENASGDVIWHLTDHLGTVRDLVDNTGTVVNHLTYDSFGRVIAETDASVNTRYLYTGREFDRETGLYYYRARYYDPAVGRFISEDPIGFAGADSNLYGYVLNDPIAFSDPSGLLRVGTERFGCALVGLGGLILAESSTVASVLTALAFGGIFVPAAVITIAAGAGLTVLCVGASNLDDILEDASDIFEDISDIFEEDPDDEGVCSPMRITLPPVEIN